MKKKRIVILSVIVIAVMLLCALVAPGIIRRRETLGLTLTVKDATASGATLQCERQIGFVAASVNTGRAYYLERQTADGWERVPELPDDDSAWPLDAVVVSMGLNQWELNYGDLYGQLPAGTYRVYKWFYTHRENSSRGRSVLLYAEFEVQ